LVFNIKFSAFNFLISLSVNPVVIKLKFVSDWFFWTFCDFFLFWLSLRYWIDSCFWSFVLSILSLRGNGLLRSFSLCFELRIDYLISLIWCSPRGSWSFWFNRDSRAGLWFEGCFWVVATPKPNKVFCVVVEGFDVNFKENFVKFLLWFFRKRRYWEENVNFCLNFGEFFFSPFFYFLGKFVKKFCKKIKIYILKLCRNP